MITYIKVSDKLYTPLSNVLEEIAGEAGLPKQLEYYYINDDGYLASAISSYHNRVEENVVEKDPEKIELAKAIKLIDEYFSKKISVCR